MDKITAIYGEFWRFIGLLLQWVFEGGEKVSILTAVLGGLLGLYGIEKLYFTEAENVRLLFVILLAPVGIGIGAGLGFLASLPFRFAAIIAVIGLGLAISVAPALIIIYALYNIIIWTN